MRMNKDRITAILMIMPSIILLAIFVYGFIGQTVYASLTDWGTGNAGLSENPQLTFVGLKNYESLFNGLLNNRFRIDLVNTVFFTIFFLIACLGLGLIMAILLDQKIRGEGIFRTVFLFPMALSFVVTGTVWRWLFQPNGGLNRLPTVLGLPAGTSGWFTDRTQILQFQWDNMLRVVFALLIVVLAYLTYRAMRRRNVRLAVMLGLIGMSLAGWYIFGGAENISVIKTKYGLNVAIFSVVIAATWQMSGYTMAMYLAGLRGIPDELREAARVDGCTEIQVYRFVVLPLLQPITLSATIILGHISLKIFDLIFVMAGETNLQVDVPGINMYLTSFRANQFSLGAAIAVIMLLMVAVIIIPYLINTFRSEVQR